MWGSNNSQTEPEIMGGKAVVLVSGGIDSSICLAIAAEDHDVIHPVHINYGQQTSKLEAQMAFDQCKHVEAEVDVEFAEGSLVDYRHVFKHFDQGVASDRDSFTTEDGELVEEDGRSTGYVPMRNMHLITTASAIADVNNADYVYHGAQGGDEDAYPDCRPQFMNAAQVALNASLADGDEMILRTPLIDYSKTDVIRKGDDLPINWEYTYSCYSEVEDLEDPEPCGECPACEERIEAFRKAGVEDPYMPA